jgi:hypothetical protein
VRPSNEKRYEIIQDEVLGGMCILDKLTGYVMNLEDNKDRLNEYANFVESTDNKFAFADFQNCNKMED